MAQEKTKTTPNITSRIGILTPSRFKVILHNDDFTTMDFVVMILTTVFRKSQTEAESLMMQVHTNGEAVAGVYTYDIAATKVRQATELARRAGFPLRLSVKQE